MTSSRTYQQAEVLWAKSWPFTGELERWLPLWQHLDDSADVAEFLWDEWVAPAIKAQVAEGLPSEGHARSLFVWMAASHDLGKATPAFACQTKLSVDVSRAGLTMRATALQDRAQLRHEVASGAILHRWLGRHTDLLPRRRRQLTGILAGHHGAYPVVTDVESAESARPTLFGNGDWITVQDFLCDRAATRAGIDSEWLDWSQLEISQPVQMILTGLVIMADWIASDESIFPLLDYGDIHPLDVMSKTRSRRAEDAWATLAFQRPWVPAVPEAGVDEIFADRFGGHRPRPVQSACGQLALETTEPGLMIVEAPMGEGKTEAAMLAAEILAARFGLTGCYWALPTQATSNAMFARMLSWLEELPDGSGRGRQTVALVHGKAFLNEEYTSLPLSHAISHVDQSRKREHVEASVHEWFRGRKRAVLSSFVAGTIDSVLFAALVSRHLMLRHVGLASKVLVIDEVHAADIYMSQFLDMGLHWLGALGVPVVLLSATLPPRRRSELYNAYESGRRGEQMEYLDHLAEVVNARGYPLITATGASGPRVIETEPSGRATSVRLAQLDDDLFALSAVLEDRIGSGGCAVVIRNTVRRAQETAAYLAEKFGEEAVTLVHAQFLAADRIRNDDLLLELFGQNSESRPVGPHVVVATQVVEQSLDVDFDLMVTDLAPIDLVLQRIGRLHRHERPDRVVPRAECYIAGVDWEGEIPSPIVGSSRIYGEWPLLRALAVLSDRWDSQLRLPEDIPNLVRRAYGDDAGPAGWEVVLDQAEEKQRTDDSLRRRAARTFRLPEIASPGSGLFGLSRLGVGNVDEDNPKAQRHVRDGEESVEVIVVQRGADGTDRIPDWVSGGGEILPFRSAEVPYSQARLLATCTLRLPFGLSHAGIIDQVIEELEENYFEGWSNSPFLSGQLALVLDDDARGSLAGRPVEYDTHRGFIVHAPTTDGGG